MHRRTPALAAFALLASAGHAEPVYRVIDITPDGYSSAVAFDINAEGDVVGIAQRYDVGTLIESYFVYDSSEGTHELFGEGVVHPRGSITGTGFREAAINDAGVVAGTARFLGGASESRGFVYGSGTFTSLGTLYLGPGTGSNIRPASDALDINSGGMATGTASSGAAGSDNLDGYVGTGSPISDFDGDLTAATKGDRARAINDAGLVVGSNESNVAASFSGAAETILLAGTSLDGEGSTATDVNESGVIAGHTTAGASFVFTPAESASVEILPNLGTGNRVFAKAINEGSVVVGWADITDGLSGQGRGFVRTGGTSYALEHQTYFTGSDRADWSDWIELRSAWGINDDGWIVGVGSRRYMGNPFPNSRAYLLIPTCEADVNADGVVGPTDFGAWLTAYNDGDSRADQNNDGVVSPTDFGAWLGNYNSGCVPG